MPLRTEILMGFHCSDGSGSIVLVDRIEPSVATGKIVRVGLPMLAFEADQLEIWDI